MKISWHTPHKSDGTGRINDPVWPEGWPLPQVGNTIYIDDTTLWVRAIDFFPQGEEEGDEPSIYIVLALTPTR